ncbi:MAG TPA: hypothetical protein VH500_00555 [Nitrososphaeraceae archaeon]
MTFNVSSSNVWIIVIIALTVLFMQPIQLDQITRNHYKNIAYAQNNGVQNTQFSNNATQLWTDKNNGVKIIFGYSPSKPIVDSPTELRFIVQDLKTSKNLKNLLAHVIITANSSGQERTFRFNNITAPNGYFSLKYLFPDYGTYQVIANVRSNISALALASFPIIIPPQSLIATFSSGLYAGIAIVVVGITVLAGVLIKTRKS